MKLSFKCYLAFVLAFCLLIPFCSCGQTKTTEAKATETPSTETPTTETPTGTPVTPTPETETPTPETPIPPNPEDDPDIDPILSSDIKRAYAWTVPGSPAPEKLAVCRYFGSFSGCAAVMIEDGGMHPDYSSGAEVAGYALLFGSTLQPWLYKDGTIASFGDAYDSGMITERDVFELACAACHRMTEKEPIPVNERDAARIPQDVASEMKHVYFWKLSDEGSLGKITAPEQLYVDKYYGKIGAGDESYYAVRMGDGKEYPDAPRTVKVGFCEIVFPSEQKILLFRDHRFYTLSEAYATGDIADSEIKRFCRNADFPITDTVPSDMKGTLIINGNTFQNDYTFFTGNDENRHAQIPLLAVLKEIGCFERWVTSRSRYLTFDRQSGDERGYILDFPSKTLYEAYKDGYARINILNGNNLLAEAPGSDCYVCEVVYCDVVVDDATLQSICSLMKKPISLDIDFDQKIVSIEG